MNQKKISRSIEIVARIFTSSEYKVIVGENTLEIKYDDSKHKKFAKRFYLFLVATIILVIYSYLSITSVAVSLFFLVVFTLGVLYILHVNKKVERYLLIIDNFKKHIVAQNHQTNYKSVKVKFSEIESLEVKYNTLRSEYKYFTAALHIITKEGNNRFLIEFQSKFEKKPVEIQAEQFKKFIETLKSIRSDAG